MKKYYSKIRDIILKKLFDVIVNRFSNLFPYKIRGRIYKFFGISIGENSVIRKDVFFESNRVKIEKNSFINTFFNRIQALVFFV